MFSTAKFSSYFFAQRTRKTCNEEAILLTAIVLQALRERTKKDTYCVDDKKYHYISRQKTVLVVAAKWVIGHCSGVSLRRILVKNVLHDLLIK